MTPPGDADTPDRRASNALIVMLLDHLDETSPSPKWRPAEWERRWTLLGNHPQLGTPALPRAPAARSRLGLRRGLAQFHQHPDAGQLPTGTGGEIRRNLLSEIHAGVLRGVVEGTGHSLRLQGSQPRGWHQLGTPLPKRSPTSSNNFSAWVLQFTCGTPF
ncbi:MAG: hypothetical protein U1U88_001837 [Lawsonella clevelandensis]